MNAQTLFREGQDLFVHGHPKESIEMFTKAYEAGYDLARAVLSRGAAYLEAKDYDKAIADFATVLSENPENERGFYYRGIAYLNKGEFDKAISDFNNALALNPLRGPAFLGRGIAHAELGHDTEAATDFKAAVAYSNAEVEGFGHAFGNTRTLLDRSMALLEGERGPLKIVLTQAEIDRLRRWIEPE